MTRSNRRGKYREAAITSGPASFAPAPLFGYVENLFRQVGRAWPSTLSDYIRAEEFFTCYLAHEQKHLRTTI